MADYVHISVGLMAAAVGTALLGLIALGEAFDLTADILGTLAALLIVAALFLVAVGLVFGS